MIAKEALRKCSLLIGRRNLYRASRFLMRAARGDFRNDIAANGECIVQAVALRTSAPPATIIDIGAHMGEWTASLLEISDSLQIPAQVHAFEPCAGAFKQVCARFGSSPHVTLVNKACSQHAGTAFMHVYDEGGGGTNSLAEPLDTRTEGTEEVQLTTIDLYCEENAIKVIDLLKIDAEGHDLQVISGASGMLDRQAIRILQFEYNHRWIGSRAYLRDAFCLLTPKGYVIGKLTGSLVEFYPQWRWELEHWTEGNYVACSPSSMHHFRRQEPKWLS